MLHDTTTRTWALRHILRAAVQLGVPIGLVLLLVPGEFWIRGMAALGGILLALFFSTAYMPETTENRVKRAGYPAGTAKPRGTQRPGARGQGGRTAARRGDQTRRALPIPSGD